MVWSTMGVKQENMPIVDIPMLLYATINVNVYSRGA